MATKTKTVLTLILLLNTFSFAQDSEHLSQIQFGVGFGYGLINPTDFYEYIDSFAQENADETTNSLDNMSFSPRIFIGYRFNNLTFRLSGEYGMSLKGVYSDGVGTPFYLIRLSSGFEANYYIPLKTKIGLLAGGGILGHKISITKDSKPVFSGDTIGYRIQVGFNFFPSKKITIQGLLAYNYAKAEDEGMELDYSGLNIRANIIFGKDFF